MPAILRASSQLQCTRREVLATAGVVAPPRSMHPELFTQLQRPLSQYLARKQFFGHVNDWISRPERGMERYGAICLD
jgi:hypothetical protein